MFGSLRFRILGLEKWKSSLMII